MPQIQEDHQQDYQTRSAPDQGPPGMAESTQPFRLVKYFSVTGFIVILVLTLLLSIFISQQAKGKLLKKSNDYALLMAENLNHQVFMQFVVPVAARYGWIQLRNPDQAKLMDAVVRNTIHSFKVQQVNIYNTETMTIYSTDKYLVGTKRTTDLKPYQDALKGEKTSTLITRPGQGLTGFDRKKILKTFYPFRAEKPVQGAVGHVLGVFEIFLDLTDDYAEITKFQYLSVAVSLVFIMLLFLILRPILSRAEIIMEERAAERRRLLERLHHSQRLANLGQMIAAVSHEIRNPLGIVSSTAELLENKMKKYEPESRLAEVIVEESRRLDEVVTEFLDFARPQAPRPEPCRLDDILDKNLAFLSSTLEKEGIEVVRDYQGRQQIEADPDLLYRAFLNVFMNAVQAMSNGERAKRIKVKTWLPYGPDGRSLGQAEAVIADTGRGMDPDQIENVFNPFFTTRNRGSGLGLAIVKNIIESHKGTVAIEPGDEGGTRVIVRLPLSQD